MDLSLNYSVLGVENDLLDDFPWGQVQNLLSKPVAERGLFKLEVSKGASVIGGIARVIAGVYIGLYQVVRFLHLADSAGLDLGMLLIH